VDRRKLQIFLSSTYEDLIDQRLAAMEAILAAGHIPAAMEQFSPGDETAWEKIQRWIDESDAFILILGGRYGSLEPGRGKSYVQLEYEYALERKKPLFSLVISEAHHEQRVKELGLGIDERAHRGQYDRFRSLVTERLCRFWNDKKDIQAAIFQKLPEWMQRPDLVGWIRADAVPTAEVTKELARLSQENRDLRSKLAAQADTFDGLPFEEMVRLLRNEEIPDFYQFFESAFNDYHRLPIDVVNRISECKESKPRNVGELFDALQDVLAAGEAWLNSNQVDILYAFNRIAGYGLIQSGEYVSKFILTDLGRRFRNRLLQLGGPEERRRLWRQDSQAQYIVP
jgi:uncharacterized protein DUF4062